MFRVLCGFESKQDRAIGRTNAVAIIPSVKISEGRSSFRFGEEMEFRFTNKTKFQQWVGRMIDQHVVFSVQVLEFPTRSTREERNDDLFVKAK